MITINQIDHINMKVKNLEATIEFYRDLFGFEIKKRKDWKGKEYAIIGVKDKAYLCVYEVGDLPRDEKGVRLNHFGFHVKNFEDLESRLREKGIPMNYGGVVEYGKSRSIYIEDPNGFEIELSEHVGGNLE